MEIIVIRHGESEFNKSGIIQGHIDIPLSENGKEQAKELAERLSDYMSQNGKRLLGVYSSDLKRAAQTAEPFVGLMKKQGMEFDLAYLEELREVNLGVWQGKTKDELLADISETGRSLFQEWLDNPRHIVPKDAESMPDFYNRAILFTERIINKYNNREGIAAVFTHGGVVSMILNYAGHRTPDDFIKYSIPNATGKILKVTDGNIAVVGEV